MLPIQKDWMPFALKIFLSVYNSRLLLKHAFDLELLLFRVVKGFRNHFLNENKIVLIRRDPQMMINEDFTIVVIVCSPPIEGFNRIYKFLNHIKSDMGCFAIRQLSIC